MDFRVVDPDGNNPSSSARFMRPAVRASGTEGPPVVRFGTNPPAPPRRFSGGIILISRVLPACCSLTAAPRGYDAIAVREPMVHPGRKAIYESRNIRTVRRRDRLRRQTQHPRDV